MTPVLSRRGFLKTSGVLVVGFAMHEPSSAQVLGGPAAGSPPLNRVDSWIAIASDGSVTAFSGKEELGQGISVAQAQLVAEELCVAFDRVKLLYCDTALTPDQAHTSGSQSHPTNFNHGNLAQACATAREALVRLASERLGMTATDLAAENGTIVSKSERTKSVTYGELIGSKKFNLTLDPKARRKDPATWTVLGKPVPRPDLPAIMTGEFEFVHNVRVPGMLHGRVVRPPAPGATLIAVDESSVAGLPGVVKVVVRKNFAGVVAEKPWQAMDAATKLKVTWSKGTGLPAQAEFPDHLRSQKLTRDTLLVDSKDVDQRLSEAATVVKATYFHPYQMHGSVGSSCAVADVQGEKATLWSATQAVWYQRSSAAMVLGLKPENIHVVFRRGSGCYGLNGADTVTYDAALLSQAVGKPVRVQLTRKDEMAWENYGNAFLMDERAGLDAQGNILGWEHESWSPGLGNRPGLSAPGNVITGYLAGFMPEPFNPRAPAPDPATFNNNSNGVPSYLAGRVRGENKGTGTVRGERVLVHNVVSPFWTGPLRSPARLPNTFAHESFMDELAAKAKADPVEFRLRHLSDERLRDMVSAAAKAAQWDSRPSPLAGNRKTGIVKGRGIACVAYERDNGYAAMVAYVEVDRDTGKIRVTRIVVSNDCGPISNPDGLRNQLEGGALQGMSRALGEEVTWNDQNVTSVDWRTYHSLPLGFGIPKIETVLVNRPNEEATGAGETSITIAAPAIANAIFDATGVRIRQVPLTPERVKAALAANV
jgi:CO/xanthine dehydrogenase Mo-binding subunit